jgi:hypothetical protein
MTDLKELCLSFFTNPNDLLSLYENPVCKFKVKFFFMFEKVDFEDFDLIMIPSIANTI